MPFLAVVFNYLYFIADNTYVSSSENDEDVLVTTEPIPVIFHRIATGNSNTALNFFLFT